MKAIRFFIAAVIAATMGSNSFAQGHDHSPMNMGHHSKMKMEQGTPATANSQTVKIKVSGNCGMCKERIEKAAGINGVSKAEWNNKTKILTLVYDPSVAKTDDIQKRIASAGHDTEKFKAKNEDYNKLPECCMYER
jgi:hypothetical protein